MNDCENESEILYLMFTINDVSNVSKLTVNDVVFAFVAVFVWETLKALFTRTVKITFFLIITARNEVGARLCFYRRLLYC